MGARLSRVTRTVGTRFASTRLAAVIASIPPAIVAIVGIALVFAAAVYAFAKGGGGGADLFITDLIGGAASSIVVFGATAGVYLMLRNWRAKRRILANLMRASREPDGQCPAVIEPLAQRLTAGAGDDALVTVDAGASRQAAKVWIARAVIRGNCIPIAITSAESESAVESQAREQFLALAERAGERGDFLVKMWSRQWKARKIVIIATGLDDGVVPGERGAIETVHGLLARLHGVRVPTVALVAEGTFPAEVVPTAILPAGIGTGGSMPVDEMLDDATTAEQAALHTIGRLLHFRNESSWTWGDLDSHATQRDLAAAGMASLVSRGFVAEHGDGRHSFPNHRVLAGVRGYAAGIGPEALWDVVLDANRSPIALESLSAACQQDAAGFAAAPNPVTAVLDRAGIRERAQLHLPVLTSVVRGLGRSGRCNGAALGKDLLDVLGPAWRPAPGEYEPDLMARVDFVQELPIGVSPDVTLWAWMQLRDAARAGARLDYPVRRALVARLVEMADSTAAELVTQWALDLGTVPSDVILQGTRASGWEAVATACHMAWLAPMVFVECTNGAAPALTGILDSLGERAGDLVDAGVSDSEGALAFLQAWAEGLAFARFRLARAEVAGDRAAVIDRFVDGLASLREPWVAGLPLAMAQAVAGRPLQAAAARQDHPVVAAWIDAFDRAAPADRAALVWDDDFAQLRSAGAELAPTAQWCLAAKAILFSAAEVKRAQGAPREAVALMAGTSVMPPWLAACATGSGGPDGDGHSSVTIQSLMAQPNRAITPTFAAVALLSRRPAGRGQAAQFWRSIEGILQQMAEIPVARRPGALAEESRPAGQLRDPGLGSASGDAAAS